MTDVQSVYIIAEIGINHNGSISLAKELIDAAVETGTDAVKFQTFRTEKLVTKNTPKAIYQQKENPTETQAEMLKRLELKEKEFILLRDYAINRKVEFLSTPFDVDSMNFLVKELNVSQIKLGSGEMTNAPLLLSAARTGKPIILSTGMSTLGEIEQALSVLAYGYLHQEEPESNQDFLKAFSSYEGQKLLKKKITLLHCTTEYPAPYTDINLRAMNKIKDSFDLTVGYSDHSLGIEVPIAAVALGAKVIEKHFTLDRRLPGPDHFASIEPKEFKQMAQSIRNIETALGSSIKAPTEKEFKNRPYVRKSLVAKQYIQKGEYFTPANLTVKRSGTGKSPFEYWNWLKKRAEKTFQMDEEV